MQQQLLQARDLSLNLNGWPVSSRSDGGKIDTPDGKKFLLFYYAPGVNSSIGIYCFDSKAPLRQIFAFSVKRPLCDYSALNMAIVSHITNVCVVYFVTVCS